MTLNTDGSFDYTPNAEFVGSDTFRYTVTDGIDTSDQATVTIQVTNMAPFGGNDSYTASHDGTLTVAVAEGVLANDWDFDDDALSVSVVAGENVTSGALTFNADGSFSYTPSAGFIGTDSFKYAVADGAEQAEATVTIEVTNSAPQSTGDIYGVLPDQTLGTVVAEGVLANDVDADGDTMTVTLVDDVTDGALTLNADGSFTYTPTAGFTGADSFTYRASDGVYDPELGTVYGNTAHVTINVGTLLAKDDNHEIVHDGELSGNVFDNDFNLTEEPADVTLLTAPAHGTLTLDPGGAFTYTPDAGYVGEDVFTYELNTATVQSNTATVSVDVVNTAPRGFDWTYRLAHDTTLNETAPGVLFNAWDAEDDSLTASLLSDVANGTLTFNSDGSFDYTPNPGFTGDDTFTYTVTDALADSDTVTVTLEVSNNVPVSRNDRFRVHAGQTLAAAPGVLANDDDWDGDGLSATLVSDVGNGVLTLNADGSFDYTPNADFIGADTFSYTAGDGLAESTTATVTVEVTNTAPAAFADSYAVMHDTSLVVDSTDGLLANDADWDGDTVSVSTVVTNVAHGTLTLHEDGSFEYTPDTGFIGTDSFTYKNADGFVDSAAATVTLSVTNNAPVALDDAYITGRNVALSVDVPGVLGNDADFDSDPLALSLVADAAHGSLVLNSDGSFSYTPSVDYVGTDLFTYKLNDGIADSDTVTVSIEVINAVPTAGDDKFEIDHDNTLTAAAGRLLVNDFDLDGDTVSASLVSDVSHGTLTLNADGSFTYTPAAGFVGLDSFQYQIGDGVDTSDPATVEIGVGNSSPTVRDGWHRILHDTTLAVSAEDGLFDGARDAEGDAMTLTLTADVNHGTLTIGTDGSYTYTPAAAFVGADSFTYRASDGIDNSTTATVTIDVTNTAPAAGFDAYPVTQDTILSADAPGILTNDADFDEETLTVSLFSDVHHGTLTLGSDGSFTYSPDAGYAGPDTFTYRITDGIDDAYATVLFEVTGASQNPGTTPWAGADIYKTTHDQELSIGISRGVLANDFDPNADALTATLVSGPAHGTLTFNDDGSFDYAPNAAFVGSESFTYKVTDGTYESPAAAVTIEVTNDVPSAANTAFDVHHGTTLTRDDVGLQIAAQDDDDDPLTFSVVNAPTHGSVTLNSDGTFAYTPDAGFTGADLFSFKTNDGLADSNSATVAVDVTNDEPTLLSQTYQTRHDQTLTAGGAGVLATAADMNGDALTASVASVPTHGTVTLNTDGAFTYTPTVGFAGTDTFTVQANDGAESSQPATVTIDVTNEVPTASEASYNVDHGGTLTVTDFGLATNAFDADGDPRTFEVVTNPASGTLSLNSDGTFTYTPNAGFAGEDTFSYRVTDGIAHSEAAAVTVNVTNSVPYLSGSTYTTQHDAALSVNGLLASGAWDADGDDLTATISQGPANGTVTFDTATGDFTYTPNAGFAGTDSFTYTVSDGTAQSDPVTVTLNVRNTAPQALDRQFLLRHDVSQSYEPGTLLCVSDPDEDPLSAALVTGPSHGTLVFNSDGSFDYTPDAGYVGTDSFTYKVNDGLTDSNTATVTLDVSNVKPTVSADYLAVKHHQTLTFTAADLLSNDFDFDGDSIALVNVSAATNGTLTYDSQTDTYTFDPGDFVGTASFTYQLNDGAEDSDPATVEIDVTNSTPWGRDISLTTEPNQAISGNLLGQDGIAYDLDDDALTVSLVDAPSNGTATVNADGTYTFTPAMDFEGADSLTVSFFDGAAASAPVTLSLSVAAPAAASAAGGSSGGGGGGSPALIPPTIEIINSPPIASDDGKFFVIHDRVLEGTGILRNDYDPDGDPLTAVWVSGPNNGTVALSSDGSFTYTPNTNYVGSDVFCYKVSDGTHESVAEAVFIEVTNRPPYAVEWAYLDGGQGSYLTAEPNLAPEDGHGVSGFVGADADGDPLVVTLDTTNLMGGSISTAEYMGSGNVFFDFTPDLGVNGVSGSFTYTASDGIASSESGEVQITVTDDPEFQWNIVDAVSYTYEWNCGTLYGSVFAGGVYSADDETVTVAVSNPPPGFTLLDHATGAFTFRPPDITAFMTGTGVSVTYTVTDTWGNSDTSVIYINPKVLRAGAGLSESGVSIQNGYWHGESIQNGVGEVLAWVDGENAYVNRYSGTSFYVNVQGDTTVHWSGSGASLFLSTDGAAVSPITGVEFANIAATSVDSITASKAVIANSGGDIYVHDPEGIQSLHGSIGDVTSHSGSIGQLWARGGDVGTVHAMTWVTGVMAADNIARVTADLLWIGDVLANGSIGDVTAGSSIGRVSTSIGSVGDVMAGTYIDSVYSTYGSIGDVTAGTDIGSVWAYCDSIGHVLAGDSGSGNITEYVMAGTNIASVQARGELTAPAPTDGMPSDFAQKIIDALVSDEPHSIFRPDPVPAVIGGTIGGPIKAGGSIGAVFADGDIFDTVKADDKLAGVKALGDIAGAVTAGSGNVTVMAMGALQGDVTAIGNIFAYSYDALTGDLDSSDGSLSVTCWSDITGDIDFEKSLSAFSHGTASGAISSPNGGASILALDGFTSALSVKTLANVLTLGPLGAALIEVTDGDFAALAKEMTDGVFRVWGDVWAYAVGDIDRDIFEADRVSVTTWGSYSGEIDAQKDIGIEALGDVNNGSGEVIRSHNGSIRISGENVGGDIITLAGGDHSGNIVVNAWGGFDGAVDAFRKATISAYHDIQGSIRSGELMDVYTLHDIDATIEAGADMDQPHSIKAWGSISGSIEALSSVDVMGYEGLTANVTVDDTTGAAYPERADVKTWGAMNGDVTAGDDVNVYAAQGYSGTIEAEDDVNLLAWGPVSGSITAGAGVTPPTTPPPSGGDDDEQIASVMVFDTISGSITANHGASVIAHGTIGADINVKQGDAAVSALVHVDETAPESGDYTDSASDIEGDVTATGKVTVQASGAVTSSKITGGGLVTVSAHGEIDVMEIKSTGNDVCLSSDDAIGDGDVDAAQDALLGALKDVDAKVKAGRDVSIYAGGSVAAHAEANTGSITVTAVGDDTHLGNVSSAGGTGDGLRAAKDVTVTAFGNIQNVPITSAGGRASLYADQDILSSNVTASKGIAATALGDINSSQFSSTGGAVDVSSLGYIPSVTITAALNANVSATKSISGTVTSRQGSVTVFSSGATDLTAPNGDIAATITANQDATATALGGSVAGKVTATNGDASVTAFGQITEQIKATAGSVDAYALGNITITGGSGGADIDAGGDANVTALGELNASVTAGGQAVVTAGSNIPKNVTAELDVTATAMTGQITGDIESNVGSADVFAMGNVSGAVQANIDAQVLSFGSVTDDVTATTRDAIVIARGGQMSGDVIAGADATVFALGDVAGSVTAANNASVTSFANVCDSVDAGRDAHVFAGATVPSSAPVSAGRNAEVTAFGGIYGDVTATSGDALVSCWGSVDSTVSAGKDAIVFGGGSTSGTITAGQDVHVQSMANTNVTVPSGGARDAYVWSAGPLTGTISPSRNGSAVAYSASTMSVTAGYNAAIFTLGNYQGQVTGGNNASAISLGTFGGVVTGTDGSASVYAVDGAITAIVSAGEYASLVTWGAAQGPSSVTGPAGASLWAYGDIDASVSSFSGPAVATTYGNASSTSVSGADAALFAVGNAMASTVNASKFAGAITLGNFNGTVSGKDAVILSEGSVSGGSLVAATDGYVYAVGSIMGSSFSAGRDIGAATYGTFDSSLSAGRNVTGVWARGDIRGTIAAGGSIGAGGYYGNSGAGGQGLFAHGSIDAMLLASDISSVQAVGPIDGTFVAQDSISGVSSGGAVSAALSAQNIGAVSEFVTGLSSMVPPDVPASAKTEVLNDVATARGKVLAGRQQLSDDFDALMDEFATAKSDAAAALSKQQFEIVQENDETRSQAKTDLNEVRSQAKDKFAEQRKSARTREDQQRSRAEASKTAERERIERERNAGTRHYDRSVEAAIKLRKDHEADRSASLDDKVKAANDFMDKMNQATDWETPWRERLAAIPEVLSNMTNPFVAARSKLQEARDTALYLGSLADESQMTGNQRLYVVWGGVLANAVGLRSIVGAFDGADPYTLEKWGKWERLYHGITGGLNLVATAAGTSALFSRIASPCASFRWKICFTEDMSLAVPANEAIAAPEPAAAEGEWNALWFVSAVGAVAIGTAGRRVAQKRRKQKMPVPLKALDQTFANDPLDELWRPRGTSARPMVAASSTAEPSTRRPRNRLDSPLARRESKSFPAIGVCRMSPRIEKPRQERVKSRLVGVWFWTFLLLTTCCLFKAMPSAWLPGNAPMSATAQAARVTDQAYSLKGIAEFQQGDTVLAFNYEAGQLEERRVLRTFENTTDHLRILEFVSADGKRQRIETTNEHPFALFDQEEYVAAKDLEIGDRLRGPSGEILCVESTICEPHPEGVSVYNVEVEGLHNYFVAAAESTSPPVLAHNMCKTNAPKGTFQLPKTWRSAKGVRGTFSDGKHTFRIDTEGLSPGERFHVHVKNAKGKEIAVIQGRGSNGIWRDEHRRKPLLMPSEAPAWLRTDIRRLLRNALKNIE